MARTDWQYKIIIVYCYIVSYLRTAHSQTRATPFFRNCVNYLRMAETVSAGSHFSLTVVSAGSKRSRTVSTEAKAKISRLFYTLCLSTIKMSLKMAISVMYLSFKNDRAAAISS